MAISALVCACQAGQVEPPEDGGEDSGFEDGTDAGHDAGPDGDPGPDSDSGPDDDAGLDEGPDLDPCAGHCGNSQQDCGEEGSDCGGECNPCPPPGCTGEVAYLHGDLWPMWYNMRVACDPEHKALWRCERLHGAGAADCAVLQARYGECTAGWGSPWPCLNWGVCGPVEGTVCSVRTPDICDTRTFDYDSPGLWGSYYGWQWGSSTDLHRFVTVHVRDAGGTRVAAWSARPGSADAYMDGIGNFGVGPEPQGFIQLIRDSDPERYTDRFGSFACIRLPAGAPLTLQALWMNDFCHTCAADYTSYPDTPCRTDELTMTFEAGRHYLWTERGLERMEGCTGPPAEIADRLPGAACSTAAP